MLGLGHDMQMTRKFAAAAVATANRTANGTDKSAVISARSESSDARYILCCAVSFALTSHILLLYGIQQNLALCRYCRCPSWLPYVHAAHIGLLYTAASGACPVFRAFFGSF